MTPRSAALLALVLVSIAVPARAQASFTTMGRLFTTPADRILLDQQRRAAMAQNAQAVAAPPAPPAAVMPGMAADNAAAAPPPPPAPVRFGGVLRRSDGQATIWVDDAPRDTVLRTRPGAAVAVDVGGRSVVLKPGQSWDPASGAILDVRRGTPAR